MTCLTRSKADVWQAAPRSAGFKIPDSFAPLSFRDDKFSIGTGAHTRHVIPGRPEVEPGISTRARLLRKDLT